MRLPSSQAIFVLLAIFSALMARPLAAADEDPTESSSANDATVASTLKIVETVSGAGYMGPVSNSTYVTIEDVYTGSIDLTSSPALAAIPQDAQLTVSITYTLPGTTANTIVQPIVTIASLVGNSKGVYRTSAAFTTSAILDQKPLPGNWKWPKKFLPGSNLLNVAASVTKSQGHTLLKFAVDFRTREGDVDATHIDTQTPGNKFLISAFNQTPESGTGTATATMTFADMQNNSLSSTITAPMKIIVKIKPVNPKKAAVRETATITFSGAAK